MSEVSSTARYNYPMTCEDTSNHNKLRDPNSKVVDLPTGASRNKALSTRRKTRAQGVTLCRRGFHRWTDEPKKQFDVKQGKLVSIRRCSRCGKTRTQVG